MATESRRSIEVRVARLEEDVDRVRQKIDTLDAILSKGGFGARGE